MDENEINYDGNAAGEYRNEHAFAAIKEDGSVVTWGDARYGGDSSDVANQLDDPSNPVVNIYSTRTAFVALRQDGSLIGWGEADRGATLPVGVDSGVSAVYSTGSAFAAVKDDGSVVTWGESLAGADSSLVSGEISGGAETPNVLEIFSTDNAFAALRDDGSVVAWGDLNNNGVVSSDAPYLLNGSAGSAVTDPEGGDPLPASEKIASNDTAFAVIRDDGSVITLGDSSAGGNGSGDGDTESDVLPALDGSTIASSAASITATDSAFAALMDNGTVVAWGSSAASGPLPSDLYSDGADVTNIVSTGSAFAAIHANGHVVLWGDGVPNGLVEEDTSAPGDPANFQPVLFGEVYSNGTDFVGVKDTGDSIVTDLSNPSNTISITGNSVKQVVSTNNSFAALDDDNNVYTWGAETSPAGEPLTSVDKLFSNDGAIAAVLNNGRVVTWGENLKGGDNDNLPDDLYGYVETISSPSKGGEANVNPQGDFTEAIDDTVETKADTPVDINLLGNDTDAADADASNPSTVNLFDIDDNADVVGGTISTPDSNGNVTFTPDAGFTGVGRFEYTIEGGYTGADNISVQDTAEVSVRVSNNKAPTAANDTAGITVNTRDDETVSTPGARDVTINVLANDSDPDNDTLSIDSPGNPANGTATIDGNTIVYTPDFGFSGVETFNYTIADGDGGIDTGTVQVDVNAEPIPNDDSAETTEGDPVSVDVLANDTDSDNDVLTIDSVTNGANGTVNVVDGEAVYTPGAEFTGSDSFDYTVKDSEGGEATGTVAVDVVSGNVAPVAENDAGDTFRNTPLTVDVLGNDTDANVGDTLTIKSIGSPANGGASIVGGGIRYTPSQDFSGTDSFTYEVMDSQGEVAVGDVQIEVNALPNAADDQDSTSENEAVSIDVLANDSDPDGDPLSASVSNQAANGVVTNDNGNLLYTPNAGFSGEDSFEYEITDSRTPEGLDTANVTVNVNAAPVTADDGATTTRGQPVTVDVLGNDSDGDSDPLTIDSVTDGANGTTEVVDGQVVYTPNAGATGNDNFDYTVIDGNGGQSTSTVSVTVEAGDAPVANNDTAETLQGETVTVDLLGNDTDANGDELSLDQVDAPANGSVVDNGDGTVDYTPNAEFTGEDTLSYVVSDGNGGSDLGNTTITVNAPNAAPEAVEDNESTRMGMPVSVDVLANDTDPEGNSLTLESYGMASNGTVRMDGEGGLLYTPDAGFSGEDSFEYTVSDEQGAESVGTARVTVAANAGPVAEDDVADTLDGQSVTVDVLANDSDSDGGTLSVDQVGSPANGGVSILEDGQIRYTPTVGFVGTEELTYRVSDGQGGTATGNVTINVNQSNRAPSAEGNAVTLSNDESATVDVLANDTDADGDDLTITSIDTDNAGEMAASVEEGEIKLTADNQVEPGDYSVGYTVEDPDGEQSSATVNVTVEQSTSNVSGTLTDYNGQALAGAEITMEGFGSVTTGDSGEFSFDVPVGTEGKLTVSGIEPESEVDASDGLDILNKAMGMSDGEGLDLVVSDVNQDGKVTASDAQGVFNSAAGLDPVSEYVLIDPNGDYSDASIGDTGYNGGVDVTVPEDDASVSLVALALGQTDQTDIA